MDAFTAGGLLDWSLGQLKVLSPSDWGLVLGAFVLIRASSLLGMWAYALIALPGTLAHELAHFLVALLLARQRETVRFLYFSRVFNCQPIASCEK